MTDNTPEDNTAQREMTSVEVGHMIARSHYRGEAYLDRIEDLIDQESRVVIQSDDDFDRACDLLKFMKSTEKDTEAQRKADKKPITEASKALDGFYKPGLDRIKAAIDRVNRGIVHWQTEKQREEQKKREDAALAAAERDPDNADEYLERGTKDTPAKAHTSTHGAQTHIQRRLSSVEVADWSKVPDEYKMLDSDKVKKAIRAGVEVPGVTAHYTETAVSR